MGIAQLLPLLLDEEDAGFPASNAYGISTVPTMYLVERDGTISRVIVQIMLASNGRRPLLGRKGKWRRAECPQRWRAGAPARSRRAPSPGGHLLAAAGMAAARGAPRLRARSPARHLGGSAA